MEPASASEPTAELTPATHAEGPRSPDPESTAAPDPEPAPTPQAPLAAAPDPEPAPPPQAPLAAAPDPEPAPTPQTAASPRLDQAQWETFVESIRAEFPPLAASLDHSQIVSCDNGTLLLGFQPASLSAGQVEEAGRRVLSLLQERVAPFSALRLQTLEQVADSPYLRREARTAEEEAAQREALSQHPAVEALVQRFDGELRRVVTEREAQGGR